MKNIYHSCALLFLLLSFTTLSAQKKINTKKIAGAIPRDTIRVQNAQWWDSSRKRLVPVAIYAPSKTKGAKVVLVSHDYGQNNMECYHQYSYICNYLARKGYYVISIQHELPTDPVLSYTGNVVQNRMSNWERGASNIHFVLNRLKHDQKQLDYKNVTLIGHSNGGDVSILYAQRYPKEVARVISLDNRRMPLPRSKTPKVYSIRSTDQVADGGVLPTVAEQKKYGMHCVNAHCLHTEMDNTANPDQRKEINGYILSFMEAK